MPDQQGATEAPTAASDAVTRHAVPNTLRATCWGTRGSIPSPGPATARFGGNTPCLEVRAPDDRCIIFDAGTGIRGLGNRLRETAGPVRADLFFTHFHWDHIQGVPFFAPLYNAATTVRIHGPRQDGTDIESLFARQLEPTFFPIPYDALAATLEFEHLGDEPWRRGDVEVSAMRVRHPATTVGYRIRTGDAALAYIPDNELFGASYPVDDTSWYDRLVAFLGDVDLLFHDAMLTDGEYAEREGWGHSTYRQAIRLARDAGVRRLRFFHHAPDRTDGELTGIVDALRAGDVAGDGLDIGIAAEGETLDVPR